MGAAALGAPSAAAPNSNREVQPRRSHRRARIWRLYRFCGRVGGFPATDISHRWLRPVTIPDSCLKPPSAALPKLFGPENVSRRAGIWSTFSPAIARFQLTKSACHGGDTENFACDAGVRSGEPAMLPCLALATASSDACLRQQMPRLRQPEEQGESRSEKSLAP